LVRSRLTARVFKNTHPEDDIRTKDAIRLEYDIRIPDVIRISDDI